MQAYHQKTENFFVSEEKKFYSYSAAGWMQSLRNCHRWIFKIEIFGNFQGEWQEVKNRFWINE